MLSQLEQLRQEIIRGPGRKKATYKPEGRYSFRSAGAGNLQAGKLQADRRKKVVAEEEKKDGDGVTILRAKKKPSKKRKTPYEDPENKVLKEEGVVVVKEEEKVEASLGF